MSFTSSLSRWVVVPGLALLLCLGLVFSQPAIAASIPAPEALETTVNEFLQAIPSGFYGVQDVATVKAKVAEGKALFIDVREPSEYAGGHIPGAINIPLRDLAQHLDQVPHDQPVMLYCSTGYRTGIGVTALRLLGYDNIAGFPPSYAGWQKAQAG